MQCYKNLSNFQRQNNFRQTTVIKTVTVISSSSSCFGLADLC